MRALFYSPKGAGHVNPTLPLVRGLIERGHDVTYTLTSEWKERLGALGCRYRNMGKRETFTTADYNPGAPFYRQLLPATAALLPRFVEDARADEPVVVFDSCAPWGYAVSEILGVPGICSMSTHLFDREEVRRAVGAPSERLDAANISALAEIERRWGIEREEGVRSARRYPQLLAQFRSGPGKCKTRKTAISRPSSFVPRCDLRLWYR
jgi:UDP:flavonoid glycosyltransferase YjiC (YdhE family)